MKQGASRRSRGGQSLIEFAIAFPIFLALILAVVEFSSYWGTRIPVANSARAGARYAAAHPDRWSSELQARADTIQGEVQRRGGNISIPNDGRSIVVRYFRITSTNEELCGVYDTRFTPVAPYTKDTCVAPDSVITVAVRYPFSSFTEILLPQNGVITETAAALEEQ